MHSKTLVRRIRRFLERSRRRGRCVLRALLQSRCFIRLLSSHVLMLRHARVAWSKSKPEEKPRAVKDRQNSVRILRIPVCQDDRCADNYGRDVFILRDPGSSGLGRTGLGANLSSVPVLAPSIFVAVVPYNFWSLPVSVLPSTATNATLIVLKAGEAV